VDPVSQFTYVDALGTLLVPVLVIAVLALPRPRRFWIRCVIAVLAGWLSTVLFTLFIYNPSGIAAGHALGQHFPEGQYDNNISGIAIFFGWLCPTVLVAIFASIRFWWLRRRRGGA
jgi:hypothetical protein